MFITVTTVSFNQSVYIVNERDRRVQPVIVISNNSLIDITVELTIRPSSAQRKLLFNINCHMHTHSYIFIITIRKQGTTFKLVIVYMNYFLGDQSD